MQELDFCAFVFIIIFDLWKEKNVENIKSWFIYEGKKKKYCVLL